MGLNAKKAFVTVAATCFALLAATLFFAGVFLFISTGLGRGMAVLCWCHRFSI